MFIYEVHTGYGELIETHLRTLNETEAIEAADRLTLWLTGKDEGDWDRDYDIASVFRYVIGFVPNDTDTYGECIYIAREEFLEEFKD